MKKRTAGGDVYARYNVRMTLDDKIFGIIVAILINVGPIGIAVMLLITRDHNWRFNLRMLFVLAAIVAITAWAWGTILRGSGILHLN
jgi:hypothetical protein